MAFNVQYSFNNGAVTGTATDILQLRSAIYNYAHSGNVSSSTGSNYSLLTQCTLSGTAEGDLTTGNQQGTTTGSDYGLFHNCSSLTSVDLSNLDTSSVTSMYCMFYNCSSLTTLDLSNLDTSRVESMPGMFFDCRALTGINLSSFNTSSVTNMQAMFSGCSALTSIYVGDEWNVSNVTNSTEMFQICTNLPNYNSSYKDKTKAYAGEGGYLTKVSEYSIQLKHNGFNAFPKVAVDGTTIVDNNGIISTSTKFWTGTQAQYDAITTKDANTLYFIKES